MNMSETLYPPESVHNLVSKEESEMKKAPRYVSKFRQAVILEEKLIKDSKRLMGPAKVEPPSPDKFLKKHSKEHKLLEKTECSKDVHRTCCTVRKPPVPKRTDPPPMIVHTTRDFLKTTPVMVPMKPTPTCVVNTRGDKQLMENSGLVLKYFLKKDYGEVPAYLQKRSEAERKAQEEQERFIREQREQEAMKCLSEEERQAMLTDLKKRLDALHHQYQSLPLVIETMLMKTRKKSLEEAMIQLEKDISYIENYTTIYILKD